MTAEAHIPFDVYESQQRQRLVDALRTILEADACGWFGLADGREQYALKRLARRSLERALKKYGRPTEAGTR
jgi:hypothetical protein